MKLDSLSAHLSRASRSPLGTGESTVNRNWMCIPAILIKSIKHSCAGLFGCCQRSLINRNPRGDSHWLGWVHERCELRARAGYFIWRKVLGGCTWVTMATEGQCSWACRPHVCSITLQKGDLRCRTKHNKGASILIRLGTERKPGTSV